MKPSPLCCFLVLLLVAPMLRAQEAVPDGETLLSRAIAYHDPGGHWEAFAGGFTVVSTRPGRSDRTSHIRMDHPRSHFRIDMVLDGTRTALEVKGDSCRLEYQGQTDFSPEIAEKHRLNCERARMWRDYYTYLYGLPMKLHDPGTLITDTVVKRSFKGKEYLVLEVRYDPDTGSDTWYFYFDPETYAMQAYQFYHDREANDGEFILLEGETEIGGMRMPQTRSWYTNAGEEFLGADRIVE